MFKITAIVSLMLLGSTIWAAGLSCDSCGSECTSACGTRAFRSCCFNYLRKKRGPDAINLTPETIKFQQELSKMNKPPSPIYILSKTPDQWVPNMVSSEYRPYDDMFENRFFDV